jgi:hypothetical protein
MLAAKAIFLGCGVRLLLLILIVILVSFSRLSIRIDADEISD